MITLEVEISIFIGQTWSQTLQFIQVFSFLFSFTILKKLKIPNNAPNEHRYLHQGLSTNRELIKIRPSINKDNLVTSLDQILKRAK